MQELKPSDGPPRPALALEMTKRNKMAFIHYKQCRAVMWNTKDARDLFVQKNAAIIREYTSGWSLR